MGAGGGDGAEERRPHFPDYEPTTANLVRHRAAEVGDRTLAVIGDRRLSYAEAEAASADLARGLLATGAAKGTRVGLLAPNGPEWITGFFAITRVGAVAVLANTYHQAPELRRTLAHGDVQALLTVDRHLGHDYLDRLEAVAPALAAATGPGAPPPTHPYLDAVWVWGEGHRPWARPVTDLVAAGETVADEHLAAVEARVHPADPAVVVYSSGTTAEPKGAVHAQGAVVRHAHNLWQFRDLTADDVVYTPMPLFWVGGFSFTLLAAVHAGATVVFEDRFEPGATLDLLERERVTCVLGWPHMGKALVEHPSFDGRDLSSIRSGSLDVLLPPDLRPDDPGLRVGSLGMTETLGPHLIGPMGSVVPESKRGSFGRTVPGLEHKVVDPATGADRPPGELGELWVRGYSLMLGLHRRERADVFTPDGWYRTGDVGWFDEDGHFYFKGRMGETIKAAGMNVTPREVELVLEEQPEVMHAVVVGVPHPDRGEDVAAAVVVRPGAGLEADEARRRLREELSSYKVPRHVAVLATEDDLPWLDSGKIDRRGVAALLADRFADD